MAANCPHCSKPIEIFSQKDITETYGISQSAITQRRAAGKFPDPWDTQASRLLWLKTDLDAFFAERSQQQAQRYTSEFSKVLRKVPADQRDSILLELQAMLQHGETVEGPLTNPKGRSQGRSKVTK